MGAPGSWIITLLLFHLFGSGTSSPVFTNTPSLLPEILLPFPTVPVPTPPFISNSGESTQGVLCPLKLSPSTVVVRYGDPVKANCSIKRMGFPVLGWYLQLDPPVITYNGFLIWSVERMTNWTIKPVCFALAEQGGQCDIALTLIVYKPPDRVSITFVNHTGQMIEGDQYTVQCNVTEVAPVENLIVTFYRGQNILAQLQSNNSREKKPVTESFTLDIVSSKEDNGAEYWCEAKMELGPEGPQPPPVVASQKLFTKVLFAPEFLCPPKMMVTEGKTFTCEVTGNPQPSVTWFRDGQVVTLPSHLSKKDAGKYTIQAEGLSPKNFTVEVEILPVRGTANSCNGHFLLLGFLTQMINWL
ncbi:hemicentin-2-like [Archocentrus centrarchus]|uniref:hemicentin-2-like n=1 Tax=Archocentrus centrarchus TaxID=63155 RepID=UPI0011EA4EB7|nr:hemicentin-2-like [Archocentrus centrarchus]